MTATAEARPSFRVDLDAINVSAGLAELRALEHRWVCWQPVLKGDKWRKIPKRPNGANADATKKITWFPFEACADALANHPEFAGVGLVLDGSDDLVGLDFDHCLSERSEIEDPKLDDFVARLDTYTEVSPSGTGLRCFLRGQMDRDSMTFRVGDVEGVAFKSKRYLTVTGQRYPNTPDRIELCQPHLDWIAEQSARRCRRAAGNGPGRHREGGPLHGAGDDAPRWFAALPAERQLEELARMLDHLTAPAFGEYETWLRITFAIHHASDGQGYDLWDHWCQKLPGYDPDENAYKWTSIHSDREGPVTIGTVISLAKEHGYEPPPDAVGVGPELAARIAALADRFSVPNENVAPDWREGSTTAALMDATFPEPRCALPDLIPEGLTVFAGKQKSGKSWWCLSLAHAVADRGEFLGKTGAGGDVLLLALEDNPRRLQDRLRRMGLGGSPRVCIHTKWPTGKAGLEKMLDWIEQHPDARCIIIDTVRRFTGPSPSRENSYERDVTLFSPLQQAAAAARLAVIGVTHMRKDTRRLDHWQDAITGSAGLPSVADAVFLLTRQQDGQGAVLRATGRDIAEVEMPLSFDRNTCTWRTTAQALAVALTLVEGNDAERRLLRTLEQRGQPVSAKVLAEDLGRTIQAVRHLLRHLHQEGAVARTQNGSEPLWTIERATP